ncbi:hypothetical protein [Paraburkholderia humisilvae]|uniref:Lipoprotein n=1 Tax=Paraburkholderia humisilvae TaxID=627669 RepID=A0A6J5DAC8_9BURK|nr:hypothetical protein [Paraburkholderia humisilvae]CAB3749885.1 hypothetical protein LMG29542_01136 [Paraburkholderia humisilvae]
MDGDNRAKRGAACVALLTSLMLAACGADSGNTDAANKASVTGESADFGQSPSRYQSAALQLSAGASVPLAQLQAPPLTNAAPGSAVASAQASIAADAQQVAPVMRYAPDDSSNN